MTTSTRYPAQTWEELQTRLAGSFTARLRGLLAPEISLSGPEGEFGKVRRGHSGAKVTAGSLNAVIEQIGNARYRMLTGDRRDDVTLVAEPAGRSVDLLEVGIGERTYQARTSFLWNRAAILSPEGKEVARLKGNLTGRRYEVAFDPEMVGTLPVAVLILYHTIINRSRVFRAG